MHVYFTLIFFTKCIVIFRQRIHLGMDEKYEMDQTCQKFCTQLAKALIVFFLLC